MSRVALQPYRVEHHYPGTPHWLPVEEAESHDEARKIAADFKRMQPDFEVRILSQHVIELVQVCALAKFELVRDDSLLTPTVQAYGMVGEPGQRITVASQLGRLRRFFERLAHRVLGQRVELTTMLRREMEAAREAARGPERLRLTTLVPEGTIVAVPMIDSDGREEVLVHPEDWRRVLDTILGHPVERSVGEFCGVPVVVGP